LDSFQNKINHSKNFPDGVKYPPLFPENFVKNDQSTATIHRAFFLVSKKGLN